MCKERQSPKELPGPILSGLHLNHSSVIYTEAEKIVPFSQGSLTPNRWPVSMESNHYRGNRYFFKHPTLEINLNIHHWPLVLYPRKRSRVCLQDHRGANRHQHVNKSTGSYRSSLCGRGKPECMLFEIVHVSGLLVVKVE